jgi:hypothetical protein
MKAEVLMSFPGLMLMLLAPASAVVTGIAPATIAELQTALKLRILTLIEMKVTVFDVLLGYLNLFKKNYEEIR